MPQKMAASEIRSPPEQGLVEAGILLKGCALEIGLFGESGAGEGRVSLETRVCDCDGLELALVQIQVSDYRDMIVIYRTVIVLGLDVLCVDFLVLRADVICRIIFRSTSYGDRYQCYRQQETNPQNKAPAHL